MTRLSDNCDVSVARFSPDGERDYIEVIVKTGKMKVEHIIPPAGERFAFDREDWPHQIIVSVSPTGRSVHVWKDNEKIA